jgi:hypothetical protein
MFYHTGSVAMTTRRIDLRTLHLEEMWFLHLMWQLDSLTTNYVHYICSLITMLTLCNSRDLFILMMSCENPEMCSCIGNLAAKRETLCRL